MEIEELTPNAYSQYFQSTHIYNTVDFNLLNAQKVEKVFFFSFNDKKRRMGIILGQHGKQLLCPFSAPFGGFSFHKTQRISSINLAVEALLKYARKSGLTIKITLPPLFYNLRQLTETANCLNRYGKLVCMELNYHFPISTFAHYEDIMERNAKKNLHHSQDEKFEFLAINSNDHCSMVKAYEVIRRNRNEQGYPLRMTFQDVEKTIQLVHADFFLLKHEGTEIAAAQVFHVAKDIAQVIYWGDLRDYSALRPMNFFTYKLFEYYYKTGLKILDIGPSTEYGIPNYGLCDFKTSIGCVPTPKFVFEL